MFTKHQFINKVTFLHFLKQIFPNILLNIFAGLFFTMIYVPLHLMFFSAVVLYNLFTLNMLYSNKKLVTGL